MHWGASPMESDVQKKARIDALNGEIDAIYFADRQYWQQGPGATLDAKIEHQQRQKRLEHIRKELYGLRSD